MGSSLERPDRGPNPESTPDGSRLFGSHGQRPWLHEVVTLDGPSGVPSPVLPGDRSMIPSRSHRLALFSIPLGAGLVTLACLGSPPAWSLEALPGPGPDPKA